MRGRKPKPTAQKELEGNPGKRPLNEHEPQPPTTPATFEMPMEFDGDAIAQKEWQRLAPMLQRIRQITDADRGALIALCQQWSRYLEASSKVRLAGMIVKTPKGYPMVNPFLSIANKALAACRALWVELGLTPSARSRVKTSDPLLLPEDDFGEFDQTRTH